MGKIGNDVCVGCNCVILQGVNIGYGAVIAAGSVVKKDVTPYTIVVGSPARVLRKRFSDEIIEKFLELQWWNYGPNGLKGLKNSETETCITELEERIKSGFPLYTSDEFEIYPVNPMITKISAGTKTREVVYNFNKKG